MKRMIGVVLGWLVMSITAQAASFDCGKAATKVEKLICSDSSIGELDDEMSTAYQWALMRVKDKQQVIKAQRTWLKTRDACGEDSACLWDAFPPRIRELEAQVKTGGCYTLEPILDNGKTGKVLPIEPVCEVLEKNLNRFCDQPPMVCGLKVAPAFRDKITFPTWTPIESKDNLALIEAFIRAPWQDGSNDGSDQRRWDENRADIEQAIKEKRLTFSQANLDLYNLGQAQPAYRLDYDYGNCEASNPGLNERRQWEVLRIHPVSVQIQHAPDVVRKIFSQYRPLQHGPLGEVLLFEGKVYDYGMGSHEPEQHASDDAETAQNRPWYIGFGVNRHERWSNLRGDVLLHMNNICRFQYQPN
jgi:uncharacterized protein